jgi:uncharacterized BrkB/YihY/UPF0761 family membrane protein
MVSFYDDRATHHAAALTYYALMSLFPTLLLAVSLLGLWGSSQLPTKRSSATCGVVPKEAEDRTPSEE